MVEGGEIKHLFKELFGEEPYSLDTKWVRVLGPKEATSTHSVRGMGSSKLIEMGLYDTIF